MPNRIIKESICTSDNLNELSDKEEIFFYRVLVNCDDYGIMDARAAILRSKCFPLRLESIKEKDIEQWLKALYSKNLIFLYTHEGKRYLKMTSWEKHQQIRASKSKYPTPDLEGVQLISIDINGNLLQANVPVIQSNPIQSESNQNRESKYMGTSPTQFKPPTLEDVQSYCQERNNSVNPEKWYDFYSAKGWMVGKNKMKDWKAAVRTWEQNSGKQQEKPGNIFLEIGKERGYFDK